MNSQLKAMRASHLGLSSWTDPPEDRGLPLPMSQGAELPSRVQSTHRIVSDNKMIVVLSFGGVYTAISN